MFQANDVLLTLAGGENIKNLKHFKVTEQKKSHKNQHIYFF